MHRRHFLRTTGRASLATVAGACFGGGFASTTIPVDCLASMSVLNSSNDTSLSGGYYPPPEADGGWRKNTDPDFVRALGMDAKKLDAFGSYNLSLKSASNVKGCIVLKDGWIIGEWYEGHGAKTFQNYISSNGKAWAMLLFGILAQEYGDRLSIGPQSKVYDRRWLAEGFPLSDPRKEQITFEHVFRHSAGILPESVGDTRQGADWDFRTYTVGRDPDYPKSATLVFEPGAKDDYSSVSYNHLSLVFRNVSGMLAKDYLWNRILAPIGFGDVSYKRPAGMDDYHWACSGQTGPRMTTRDYLRLGYLMLRCGRWAEGQVFPGEWLDRFMRPFYPNIRSNADAHFGGQYPADLFRTAGSGMNWAFMVPSHDLVAVRTSRCYESWDEHTPRFLEKLFDCLV